MSSAESRPASAVATAMLCSAVVAAQFVGGKAVRDALYLARLDVTTLPTMVIATSAVSIVLAGISAKILARVAPSRFVPMLFMTSTALLLVEWLLISTAPTVAVILVYLHISGLGPMLGSGFWLMASERFDPRTAKLRFGQIQGAGTLGGLFGGLLAERVGATLGITAMLPVLAALNACLAWKVRQLQSSPERRHTVEPEPDLAPAAPQSGLRVLAEAPYLRNLAALVLLGTLSATLVDYLFKVEAVRSFGRGESLLRFFAIYYASTSLITFVVQTSSSRLSLERLGLAVTAGAPSLSLLVGGAGTLLAPGIKSLIGARAGETILRGSLFRAAYELFYTPIPPVEKRAAKSIIDVGFDRLGDAVGGAAVRFVLLLAPAAQQATILSLAMSSSALALLFASRLNRGYIQTLERSLLKRAVELDLSDAEDLTTRTTMLRTLRGVRTAMQAPEADGASMTAAATALARADREVQAIVWLRSRDREQVFRVLQDEEGITSALVPHVIPLLAWDPAANHSIYALRKVAEEHVGQLVDALIDPNQDFAVRRRLARVFSVCVSQRAVDGLMLGLDDLRFEVRFQCGISLSAILEKNSLVRIDRERVFAVLQREVTVGRPVWESHRLLDAVEPRDTPSFVDEFVRDRASQSLAHVFTLLSLVLPREPLQIAFRGLHTEDRNLQGTALEYLEGVLPAPIRERLWPYLEDRRPAVRPVRARDEILADLLRSNQSIVLNLEELKRRAPAAPAESASGGRRLG